MASEHIVKSFDDELIQLNAAIAQMGELSQTQLSGAIAALTQRDAHLAAHVIKDDLDVDAIERKLDAHAIRVLALRQPIARDLREVLSAIKIGTEFERICDFAANIAKRAIAIEDAAPDDLLKHIAEFGALASEQIADVIEAFRNRNAEEALAVWAHDEQLDDAYTIAYRRVLDFMKADVQRVTVGAHLLFISKNIERIGDHATNIAESVYYLVSGETLTAERPKGDSSSLFAAVPKA